MNTNALKKFAQETRRKLMEQVAAKMQYVLHTDSPVLREKSLQVQALRQAIEQSSESQVIDKVAYTWFNRLMALRFMDANDYQPLGVSIITPKEGYTLPELLDEAKQGNIPTELTEGSRPLVDVRLINDLLNERIPSHNAQNEVYTHLLIGACNHLSQVFPFLYERIEDYSELLLPDDLTSERSVVNDIRTGMNDTDCQEVEIIGWLYQFYISEKKDEVFAAKAAVKKEDIPAATQLFTPRWIVEYMVQNTLGKLWLQNRPNSRLRELMPYYIESAAASAEDFLKINSVEEITLLDQACGSGHILVYGFELFSKIYEEEGYNPSEIPALIIEKNLFGFEIDERAAQLAGLALMMKARSGHKRFFRKQTKPNILCYRDFTLSKDAIADTCQALGIADTLFEQLSADLHTMQQATNYGSLIIPKTEPADLEKILSRIAQQTANADVFLSHNLAQLKPTIEQLLLLSQRYHCIVDNPPYMGGGNMNKPLGDFVKTHYPDSKADLMACFMEAGLRMLHPHGFLGMINQHSWMFLSSYEKLREKLIKDTFFDTLLHLGARTFPEIGGEVVQNASFTFWNTTHQAKGSYLRLVDFDTTDLKREKTIEAIQNPICSWLYNANQIDFKKISGYPFGYWLSEKVLNLFENTPTGELLKLKKGMSTGDNTRFIKRWFEPSITNIFLNCSSQIDANISSVKWFPINSGGEFRKWYGNNLFVANWENDGQEMKKNAMKLNNGGHWSRYIVNTDSFFEPGICWNGIASENFGVRIFEQGFLFSSASMCGFGSNHKLIIPLLNSKISSTLLSVLAPTLNFGPEQIRKIPYIDTPNQQISILTDNSITISKQEWNSRETSWDFQANELLRIKGKSDIDLEEAYDLYKAYWQKKFFELHRNEEALNRQFIEIYGLQDELTPDVPLEDITILKEETSIQNNQLVFDATEVMAQYVSYAVGCMFGRYSLDKQGIMLANQGETLQDYLAETSAASTSAASTSAASTSLSHRGQSRDEQEIGKETISGRSLSEAEKRSLSEAEAYLPDDDNIIPVLDDEWFEDDIVGRFKEFLKVTFGTANFERNLAFVEESLGKDIRKYFVKDFYADHIKRYKKRPIYWMFSSANGSFNVLIAMHRYTPDMLNKILNGYLVEYREKLNTRIESLSHIIVSGSSAEQTKAAKEQDKIKKTLLELKAYEREILYPLATERISIDLDDGVLVNYNKFGAAIKEISGLNDKATKKKVKDFDWIDGKLIR